MIMAAGESGCNPLATGILTDLFPEHQRALVLSIFNWGIYGGYGIAFPVGRYIPELNAFGLVSAFFSFVDVRIVCKGLAA